MARTWPIDYDGVEGATGCTSFDGMEPERKATLEAMAVDLLWHWTGRVFGTESVAIRPCRTGCQDTSSTFEGRRRWLPFRHGDRWLDVSCGTCLTPQNGCVCDEDSVRTLRLPGPVVSVDRIEIDGVELPSTAYTVDARRLLIRTDGGSWPVCQDLSAPAGGEGTWEVEYQRGVPVPIGGQLAAGTLACELAKAATRASTCQLPKRIRSVTREGVTVDMMDSFSDVLEEGRTGIWLIDSWIASVTRSTGGGVYGVRSPDTKRPQRPYLRAVT